MPKESTDEGNDQQLDRKADNPKKEDLSSTDGSDEEDRLSQEKTSEQSKSDSGFDNLERLRRQKRLAMNRESARNRRRRKKTLLETLEKQVEEMNKINQNLRATNEALTGRVAHLEGELNVAKSTIAMLSGGGGPGQQSQFGLGGSAAASGFPGVGAGGGDHLSLLAARQGFGGSLGPGSFLSDPSAFQYRQLLQQAGGVRGATDTGTSENDYLRLARERQGLQGQALHGRFGADSMMGAENATPGGGMGGLGLEDLRRLNGGTGFRGGNSFLENRNAMDISQHLAALRQQERGADQHRPEKNRSGLHGSKAMRDP